MTKGVDLFAGCGGFTEGAKRAGIKVVWAANHWPAAVECHRTNHPEVTHACQDLHQADWDRVPRHDILLAAPSCQGHSPARGKDRPHHDAARSTAWAVVSCAEAKRPDLIVCENVPEWTKWTLWRAWCQAMHDLGYAVAPHVFDTADFGVPQHRVRLIVVCTRSRQPLTLTPRKVEHRHANDFIEWGGGEWRTIDKGLCKATRSRIAAGRAQFGNRFLIPYYGSGSGLIGRSVHRPIGTITTLDRWAVVKGGRMRMLSVDESRAAMSFPRGYLLPENKRLAKHLLGNAIPPRFARAVLAEVLEAA